MLKTQIKKSLLETKDKKDRLLIEETLIKNRLSIIVEGINSVEDFKSLPKKNQAILSVKFIQELSYLSENGLLTEQSLSGALQSIFGHAFGDITQTIFEPILGRILSKLGFGDGFFKNFIISALTTSPIDFINALNDCKLMTKLLVESIIEAEVMVLQTKSGLSGMALNFVRNTIGSIAKDQKIIQELEDKLSTSVCELMHKFTDKAENVKNTLKGNVPNAMGIVNNAIA